MKYTHRDIEIEFNETRAEFSARIGGKMVRKASLAAMRKAIDVVATDEFKPFTGLFITWGGVPTLDPIEVVGLEKPKSRRRSVEWRVQGHGTASYVSANTPENVKRIKAYLKKTKERDAFIEKIDEELEVIRETIVMLSPEPGAAS